MTDLINVDPEILAAMQRRLAADPKRDVRRIPVLDWLDDSIQ